MRPTTATTAQRYPGLTGRGLDAYSNANLVERENDEMVRALIGDVRALKQRTRAMGTEVKRHNSFLDVMRGQFESTTSALGRVMGKLNHAGGWSSMAHLWLLFLFAFAVFVFIYLMLKLR